MSSRQQDSVSPVPDAAENDDSLGELRDILLRENQEYLIETVQSVITPVLSREIGDAQDNVSDTLAPIIGPSIRRQIHDAQEDIIGALYPIIGKTIRKAVAESMRDLARRVDESVRNTLGLKGMTRRVRARIQGVSEADLLLRESLPFRVQEVFLIHRESGILLAHLSADPEDAEDRDLVSGMLTAIRDFAQDAFGDDEEGDLDAIQYGGLRILLEPGPRAYLAVVLEGVAPPDFRAQVTDALGEVHHEYSPVLRDYDGDPDSLAGVDDLLEPLMLAPIAAEATQGTDAVRPPWFAIIGFAAILFLCLCLSCFGLWQVTWGRPTPTATATSTPPPAVAPTWTNTPTPTPTFTPTSTSTPTATSTPTSTPTHTPTYTPTPTPAPTQTLTPTPAPFLGVMIGNVWLRAQPGIGSPITREQVQQARPVEIVAVYRDWYQIRWPPGDPGGTTGWVPGRWVGVLAPPPAAIITPGP